MRSLTKKLVLLLAVGILAASIGMQADAGFFRRAKQAQVACATTAPKAGEPSAEWMKSHVTALQKLTHSLTLPKKPAKATALVPTKFNFAAGVLTVTAASQGMVIQINPVPDGTTNPDGTVNYFPGQVTVSWQSLADSTDSGTNVPYGTAANQVTSIIYAGSSTGTNEYFNSSFVSDVVTANTSDSSTNILYCSLGQSTTANLPATGTTEVITRNNISTTVNCPQGTAYTIVLNYGVHATINGTPSYVFNP